MNQIIRELNAAADAVIAASGTADDPAYLLGFADGIRHATRILDDSDTSGPSEPHQKRNPYDIIQDKVDAMMSRTESYLAHGY